jgi:hypothetical protein
LFSEVNSSGAVSPAARATERRTAVMIPPSAVRKMTRSEVRHCGTPSASEASRSAPGTNRTSSSVLRARVGTISTASATPPASAENRRMGRTTNP